MTEQVGDRLIQAILRLDEVCQRDANDILLEVSVGPKAYDAITMTLMKGASVAADAEDQRGKWRNGLIQIHSRSEIKVAGGITVRCAWR